MPVPTAEKLEYFYPNKGAGSDGNPQISDTVTAGSTQNQIIGTTLGQADAFFDGGLGLFTTGALAGEFFHVKTWTLIGKTLDLHRSLSAAPAAADAFILIMGGNYRTSQEIQGLDSTAFVNITGLTMNRVGHFNGPGTGSVRFKVSNGNAFYTAPGDAEGAGVKIDGGDGTFVLFSSVDDNWIEIDVIIASLPVGDETDNLTLTEVDNVLIPDFEAIEVNNAPKTRYRLVVIRNNDAADLMVDQRTYILPADDGTPTTTTTVLPITAAVLGLTDASTFPVRSFWILNTTLTDIRYVTFRSGNDLTCADAESGDERRGFTAQVWGIGDAIEVFPEYDIGLDAPAADQFESPADEITAPPGVAFSAPTDYAGGLVIGNLAVLGIYGIWLREVIHTEVISRTNFTPKLRIEWR